MNRVEIISIGNEILAGLVLDTNSNHLARIITASGGEVRRVAVVGDSAGDIVQEIQTALSNEASLIITTGGLGPTFDDTTLAAVAQALDRPLVLHAEALEWVIEKYEELKRSGYVDSDNITPSREKMAHLPDGATPLPNSVGAAPGVMLEHKKATIFCLPGVPAEMKAIFEEHVEPRLKSLFGNRVFIERNITTDVSDESKLVPIINRIMNDIKGVYLKSKPTYFGTDVRLGIRLTASGEDDALLRLNIEKAVSQLGTELQRIGHSITDPGM